MGDACPFRHETSNVHDGSIPVQSQSQTQPVVTTQSVSAAPKPSATKAPRKVVHVDSSRVVARPVAQAEKLDPRTFQLGQLKRRFSPKEETATNGDLLLSFAMPPSDPDFPFDIEALKCTLRIPPEFPTKAPSLRVKNTKMERGYQINVEHGFDAIWSQAKAPTLLNALKALDKQLEVLLTAKKADIVTLVANRGTPTNGAQTTTVESTPAVAVPARQSIPPPPPPSISSQRKAQAKAKREQEIQMLEHRMGRDPQFSKAAGDTLFTIPIEPRKRNELPPALQAVKAIRLLVPSVYDLEPCSIELLGVQEGEAAMRLETAFARWAESSSTATLMAQINYLASNMHIMAKEVEVKLEEKPSAAIVQRSETPKSIPQFTATSDDQSHPGVQDTDKEHVKIIARPPEWDLEDDDDSDSFDDSGSEELSASGSAQSKDNSDAEADDHPKEETQPAAKSGSPEKGILMSFPGLSLHGIELLELILVNLTVKCLRCKETLDVPRIRAHDDPDDLTKLVSTSCKKCAYAFTIGFRKDLLHAASTRAGYLDLEGCTPVDLLPSTFVPTCSDCSTPFPETPGVVSVRGQSTIAICRNCHQKLNFLIPEVKFLRIGASGLAHLPLKQAGKKPKESLGLVAGQPLPSRGACKHYSKSFRWFRFSCCNLVYPCDRCHDDAQDHPNEFAARMICGWCSREQIYRPEECGMQGCRKGLTGRARTGFWEGGKGTRDKKKMSRKDPRKYKRVGGGTLPSAKK